MPLQPIVIKENQRKGTIIVDLSYLGLVLDHDVLLSLQWLENDGNSGNQGITFDTTKGKRLTGVYLKQYSVGSFEKASFLGNKVPCFYLIGKQLTERR